MEDPLFHHMDRLPAGSPLPMGHVTAPPWGVRRMAPYPAMAPSWSRAEIDPDTQWAWMEPETGLPMVAAMGDLLERETA
ncbi:putative ATP-grasp-modified RiPP [Streptomyces sp. TX20-6-3]|uniref:putative ATP-grasp-modified RiPP n=1 Tax=Streptomyces sp. TX20-6-3 TaxID=3028705 RepID=UPI0029C059A6|nr:putative ATP-grasp-modified RiPP [Streptomyces sp. TX20-6-3]